MGDNLLKKDFVSFIFLPFSFEEELLSELVGGSDNRCEYSCGDPSSLRFFFDQRSKPAIEGTMLLRQQCQVS